MQKAVSSSLLPSSVQKQYLNLGEEKERAASKANRNKNNPPTVFGKYSPEWRKEMKSSERYFHIYNPALWRTPAGSSMLVAWLGEPKKPAKKFQLMPRIRAALLQSGPTAAAQLPQLCWGNNEADESGSAGERRPARHFEGGRSQRRLPAGSQRQLHRHLHSRHAARQVWPLTGAHQEATG